MDLIYMTEQFCIIFIFIVYAQEAECDATEETILECKFSENINSTQTGFSVYFDSDHDSAELLVDCVWIHQHIECIEQEGFKCNQPVSDTAIINVPFRYLNRAGTYICITEGSNNKDITPCLCFETQLGQQSETQNKREKEKPENTTHNNFNRNHSNEDEVITAGVIGFVAGAAIGFFSPLLLIVLYKKIFKKIFRCQNHKD